MRNRSTTKLKDWFYKPLLCSFDFNLYIMKIRHALRSWKKKEQKTSKSDENLKTWKQKTKNALLWLWHVTHLRGIRFVVIVAGCLLNFRACFGCFFFFFVERITMFCSPCVMYTRRYSHAFRSNRKVVFIWYRIQAHILIYFILLLSSSWSSSSYAAFFL